MSIQTLSKQPICSQHLYTDSKGTYQIDKLFNWINEHSEKHISLPIDKLFEYIVHDSWGSFEELRKTNFRRIFDDQLHRQRMEQVDLSHPVIITNFNRLIDGVHRIFKAIFEKQEQIQAVFIDQKQLNSVCLTQIPEPPLSHVENLPIPDHHFSLPKTSLPQDPIARRNTVEDYFPDHLPTATSTDEGFEVCLERPSSPYGCYQHDDALSSGLHWWREGTRVRDICAEHRLSDSGILALEEQWVPLSWSRTFQSMGKIPEEVILLHLDDHQDMMSPRIGKRLDGEMVDYITGNHIDFLDSDSISGAIRSGAIGKGSILTPLIWSIPKIHVRHLSFRSHPNTTYKIDKATYSDGILFESDNRIGLHFTDASWEALPTQSNYVVTADFDTWLQQLPSEVPILLHFDLDYFNNRFDGNSHWQEPGSRSYDPRFTRQKQHLRNVIQGIKKRGLSGRIIDTSIGISPGFYPAEFWKPMVEAINKEMMGLGVNLTKGEKVSTKITGQPVKTPEIDSVQRTKRARESKEEEKVSIPAKRSISEADLSDSGSSSASDKPKLRKRARKNSLSNAFVLESSVSVEKMAAKKFEGWKIRLDGSPCGFVKFYPKVDKVFKKHVTVDFMIPKPKRGKHIGRFALTKAIGSSVYLLFVANLRKSNTASKRALTAVGFSEYNYPGSNQLCMIFRK